MKLLTWFLILALISAEAIAEDISRQGQLTLPGGAQSAQEVKIVNYENGVKLVVNGKDFMINGMNWDYFPVGTNFSYSLWKQPDDINPGCIGLSRCHY